MRTFNFDVLWFETADGVYDRALEGAHWLALAEEMVDAGRATLVVNSRRFEGYADSRDDGYTRYNYTVTEKVN